MTATVDIGFGHSALSRTPLCRDISADSPWPDSPEPFGLSNLSFDSYRLATEPDEIDKSKRDQLNRGPADKPAAVAADGSPPSVAAAQSAQVGDTLNTPASTAADTPTFFSSIVTAIPDPVPIISGESLFDTFLGLGCDRFATTSICFSHSTL